MCIVHYPFCLSHMPRDRKCEFDQCCWDKKSKLSTYMCMLQKAAATATAAADNENIFTQKLLHAKKQLSRHTNKIWCSSIGTEALSLCDWLKMCNAWVLSLFRMLVTLHLSKICSFGEHTHKKQQERSESVRYWWPDGKSQK